MPALAVGSKLGRAIGRVLNIPNAASVRGRFLVTIILTGAVCYFVTGASAQLSERKEASQAAVRILGAWKRVAPEMYGNGLININVHCMDALGIKSYGQSFLNLADALQLEKDYGVPLST